MKSLLLASLSALFIPTVRAEELAVITTVQESGWIVQSADNICGLKDRNQLTYPASIDFDQCLAATAEMKRLRDNGIDPTSAEGIKLRASAISRLTKACEEIRVTYGYCSVWRKISHSDGRHVADISFEVMQKL